MKKKCRLVILSLAMACSLTACGGDGVSYSSTDYTSGVAYDSVANVDYLAVNQSAAQYSNSVKGSITNSEPAESTNIKTDRKLIRTIRMEIRVPSSDLLGSTVESLKNLTESSGGYVTNNDIDFGSNYAGGEVVVKIPKDTADAFISQIESCGLNVISLSDSSEDVTLEYSDVSTALEVQKIKREKYLEYLEQARDVNEILAIEDRLSDVVTQIEQYQSRLLLLDNQIEYTKVSMRISCTTSRSRDSFGERIKQRFGEIGSEFVETLLDGLEWAASAIATLVFTLPIILGVIFVVLKVIMKAVRRREGREKKNREEKKEKKFARFFKKKAMKKEENHGEHEEKAEE